MGRHHGKYDSSKMDGAVNSEEPSTLEIELSFYQDEKEGDQEDNEKD